MKKLPDVLPASMRHDCFLKMRRALQTLDGDPNDLVPSVMLGSLTHRMYLVHDAVVRSSSKDSSVLYLPDIDPNQPCFKYIVDAVRLAGDLYHHHPAPFCPIPGGRVGLP